MNFIEIKYLERIQTSYYLNLLLFKSFLLFRQLLEILRAMRLGLMP